VVREFVVAEGRERDFQKIYGPNGIWPELLRRSEEYLGTDWKLESETERRYRVFDCWRSHWGFESFRAWYQREYERFNRLIASEHLLERETFLGSFYKGDSDSGEGSLLAPA